MKPIICLDFDGVIHSYERGYHDGSIYGTWVPGTFEWMHLVAPRYRLAIFSTRSATPEGIAEMRAALDQWHAEWTERDNARERELPDIQWPATRPLASITIDDRAVRFTGDWTELNVDALRALEHTWTERGDVEMANELDEPDPAHVLRTITDEPGRRLAERLFKTYVRDQAHSARLPAFLIAVDRLISGMGGVPAPVETEEPDRDDADDDDYEDDEDIHETPETAATRDHEAALVRDAVFDALTRERR